MRKPLIVCRIVFWCLAAFIAAFIFANSAQTAEASTTISSEVSNGIFTVLWAEYSELPETEQIVIIKDSQLLVRKSAHFVAYFVLAFCICGAMNTYKLKKIMIILFSWCGATAYAVSDEVHQLFVEGRAGRAYDVVLDSAGAASGVALLMLFMMLYNFSKRRSKSVR
jgi:VanZ family protein